MQSLLSEAAVEQFQRELLAWYAIHHRDLPWRHTRDPYAIWISEIMLQQTRVTAAIPYYNRFLSRFPDVRTLASASESDLLANWAGLGYYYRARNLQAAARLICELDAFPATYENIKQLPGVGDYTAAAIASISFNLPHAVADGNVFRVLSRVLNDDTDIASPNGRKHFAQLAQSVLDHHHPGDFNQALMELGATVCLPKNPQCLVCPVADLCRARAEGRQNDLPVKIRREKNVQEHRTVFWIEREDDLLLWQRSPETRLMPGFWELPEAEQLPAISGARKLGSFRHGITFHSYSFDIVEAVAPQDLGPCRWIPIHDLDRLPLSTIVKKAIRAIHKTGIQRANRAAATASP